MVRNKDDLFSDCTELVIWNHFKRYNKIKYLFLYFLGLLSGFIFACIIWLVIY